MEQAGAELTEHYSEKWEQRRKKSRTQLHKHLENRARERK